MDNLLNLLKCPICYDFFDTAMMIITCSHNFCSFCIKKYFSQAKNDCPQCRKAASPTDLKNNRLIDEIVCIQKAQLASFDKFLVKGGDDLLKRINELSSNSTSSDNNHDSIDNSNSNSKSNSDDEGDTKPTYASIVKKRSSTSTNLKNNDKKQRTEEKQSQQPTTIATPSRMMTRSRSKQEGIKLNDSVLNDTPNKRKGRSPTKNKLPNPVTDSQSVSDFEFDFGNQESADNSKDTSTQSNDNNSSQQPLLLLPPPMKSECPYCQILVIDSFLNDHIKQCHDDHSNNNNNNSKNHNNDNYNNKQLVIIQPKRLTPIAKLCYSIMSIKQVKGALKSLGLRTNGDRTALVNRHREYTLRHNSQCDSLNPKTTEEIIEELYEYEQQTAKPKQSKATKKKTNDSKSKKSTQSPPLTQPLSDNEDDDYSSQIDTASQPQSQSPLLLTQSSNDDLFEQLKAQILQRKNSTGSSSSQKTTL